MFVISNTYKIKLSKFFSALSFMLIAVSASAGDLGQTVTPADIKKLDNTTAKYVRTALWVEGVYGASVKEDLPSKSKGKTRVIPEELVQAVKKNNEIIGF